MTTAALVVVAILAGSSLLGGTPIATAPPGTPPNGAAQRWLLTADELSRVLEAANQDGSYVGKVVVADVEITGVPAVCPAGTPLSRCFSTEVEIVGHPEIRVSRLELENPCEPGVPGCHPDTARGPMAFRIQAARTVDLLASVRLRQGALATPWQVGDLPPTLDGGAAVVDAWLAWWSSPLFCPHSELGLPGAWYGCGQPAWLTAEPPQLETVTRASDGVRSWTGHAPEAGIRLQNGAHVHDASPSMAPGDSQSPRLHGLFLVRDAPVSAGDPACMLCASRTAWLIDSVDAVTVPGSPEPRTATPAPAATSLQALTTTELVALVREASATGSGVGRTVVVDVVFELASECRDGPRPGLCARVLQGSDPAIRLFDPPPGPPCGPTALCVWGKDTPVGPGPYALTIRRDGQLGWVGWVATRPQGGLMWPFADLRERLGDLNVNQPDAYKVYVVSGSVRGALFQTDCAVPEETGDPWGCVGQPAWLTEHPPSGAAPGSWFVPSAPPDSIRLQNGALGIATMRLGRGTVLSPDAAFLVKPHVPGPGVCDFCDGPVAELIARLDPP